MTSPSALRLLEAEVGLFVAAHRVTEAAPDFTRFAADPVAFAETILGVRTLWATQQEHLRAVAEHRRVCAYGANGTGKSFDDAIIALWWIYCHGGLVIATSAKEAQLQDQYMRDVRMLFHRAPTLDGELYTMALRRPAHPESGLLCMAAGSEDRLRSYHAPRVLVQLGECQGLPPFAFESAEMMAIGDQDRVTCTGNSTQPGGEFHRRVRSPAWRAVQFDAREHPNIREGQVIIAGGPTVQSIAQRATDYGSDSGFYLASVCGVFPEESAESLVQRSWLEEAAAKWTAKSLESEAVWQQFICGVDPARFGADSTALAVRQGPVLRYLLTWAKLDAMETVGRVTVELANRGIHAHDQGRPTPRLAIDSVGIGAGVFDRFVELGDFEVKEFQGGRVVAQSSGGISYANRRAQAFWGLRRLLEMGKIALVPDAVLFEELVAHEWRVNSSGRIQIESKPDLKLRLGRSPDRADATAMCFDGFYTPPSHRARVGSLAW